MNCVLRVETATRSFIVKQSRGYVEKYSSSGSLLRAYLKVLLSKNCGGRYCTANHAEAFRD
jgi:hypothetical protein